MVTVVSSFFDTESTKGMKLAYSEAFVGSRTRSKLKTTSSTVTSDPSWNLAPSRSSTS